MSHGPWIDSDAEVPDDGPEDSEGPQACDLGGSTDADEYETVPCPHCGRGISELAERCPHCGDWIIQDARAGARRRPLWIAIAILLLVLILLWLF
jgi:predicted nucleic acid-binding Zn ribbon protein